MKSIIASLLFVAAVIITISFLRRGFTISWFLVPVFFTLLALQLLVSSARQRTAKIEKDIDENLERLKSTGEKIIPAFDNCDFKDSSYSNEIIDDQFSHVGIINFNFGKVLRTEGVEQSLLTYHHTTNDKTETFSQPFPCSADALKFYVLNGNVTLFVDRFDRSKYFFDLNV